MFLAARNRDELFVFGTSKKIIKVVEIGSNVDRVDLSLSSELEIEKKVEDILNPLLEEKKQYCLFKITSRNPLNWSLWCGSLDEKPLDRWWDSGSSD